VVVVVVSPVPNVRVFQVDPNPNNEQRIQIVMVFFLIHPIDPNHRNPIIVDNIISGNYHRPSVPPPQVVLIVERMKGHNNTNNKN
jgi:hypothetical protein